MADDVSIKDLDHMIEQLAQTRDAIAQLNSEIKTFQEEKHRIECQLLDILTAHELSSFKGSNGSVSVVNRFQVKMPKDDMRYEFKQYLLDNDAFEAMWTINHQTLNAWYKAQVESAELTGEYLDVPGLEPQVDKTISFRRK